MFEHKVRVTQRFSCDVRMSDAKNILASVRLDQYVPLRVPYVSSIEKLVRFVQLPSEDGMVPEMCD